MKTQSELLHGTNIPTDDLAEFKPTESEQDFLAVAEGFAHIEWVKACEHLGLTATADHIPENYEYVVRRAGQWTLDYPSADKL